MTWIAPQILDAIKDVEFFYLDKTATQIYNWRFRNNDQPRVFGGWCWHYKGKEGGPFRSISGARVDAYYRVIRKTAPPTMNERGIDAETVLASKRKSGKITVLNPRKRKNNG